MWGCGAVSIQPDEKPDKVKSKIGLKIAVSFVIFPSVNRVAFPQFGKAQVENETTSSGKDDTTISGAPAKNLDQNQPGDRPRIATANSGDSAPLPVSHSIPRQGAVILSWGQENDPIGLV